MQDSIKSFEFPWAVFRGVIEGTSILDVPHLYLRSMEDATKFIKAYGFDPGTSEDLELLWSFFDDAVLFIERTLADPDHPRVPDHLRSREAVKDLRRVLLLASNHEAKDEDQKFACAILRLMHVLIHIAHDPRLKYLDQVQSQILSRLDNHLHIDESDGVTYLGDKDDGEAIKLLFFKKKDRKDRDREVVKLLHKTDSVVDDIYDRIGFRLVTETKFDSVRAVRLLLNKNIISVPNVRPGRSRNRLIDMKRLQFEVERVITHVKKSGMDAPYVDKLIRRLERRITHSRLGDIINSHSNESYRAIQFTCRELVKVKNSMFTLYQRLEKQLGDIHGGTQVLNDVFANRVPSNPYDYVFFPYEIQIMDVKSYADSIFGKSSHEEYRRKQLHSARLRVFGHPSTKKNV